MSQVSQVKVSTVSSAVTPSTGVAAAMPAPGGVNWRASLEAIIIPTCAIVVALILFGIFCFTQGANPIGVFAAIYKAAFGSWYSFQNTLVRAAPLMLTALCTALPARLGLVMIGNEGALVAGGLLTTAAGLAVQNSAPFVVWTVMLLAGMAGGGLWISL